MHGQRACALLPVLPFGGGLCAKRDQSPAALFTAQPIIGALRAHALGGGPGAALSQSPPNFHPHGPIRERPKRRKRSRANRKRSTEAPEAELQNAGKRSSGKDEALGSGLAGRFEGPSGALRSGAFPGAVPGGAAAARTAQPGPPPRHRAAHGTAAARGGAGRNPPLSPSPRSPFISLPVSLWLPVSL